MDDGSASERSKPENYPSDRSGPAGSEPVRSALQQLEAYGLPEQELSRFAISHEDIVRKLRTNEKISPSEADARRVLEIFRYADEVFGSRAKAQRWLREPCRAMDRVVPIDLLESDAGAALVREELIRIEHGIYV
ncbi:antitoxin Xre/MbcA/ParS toxin-binding domain-containing protein [Rhizobium sp.]